MKLLLKKKPLFIVLSVLFLVGILSAFVPMLRSELFPDAVLTSATKRKLPIYCVDTQGKPKISISFDAAWGAC